jgi:NADH dehydrogenase FAD-containing subunit
MIFSSTSLSSSPQPQKARDLLHFVIVGHGAASIQLAEKMRSMLKDAETEYPNLSGKSHVTLIPTTKHMKNTYEKKMSLFCIENFFFFFL